MAACAFSRNGFTSLGRSIRFIIEIRFGVAVVMAATANYLIEMAEKLLESTIRRSHNTILHIQQQSKDNTMLACLVSFANEYHVFHCLSVIFENSYGLVIISAMAF